MSINRRFPNYQKTIIPVKVISHDAGPNRASRRAQASRSAHKAETDRKFLRTVAQENGRIARAERVARRVARARSRREERERARIGTSKA